MSWYNELDLEENPFQQETRMVGREYIIREAIYNATAGNMTVVQGGEGWGKTKLLKEVIKKFRGKIIYVSSKRIKKDLNIENLLRGRYGILGKIFAIKPKNMILLMDDVENLTAKNCERIKYYYDQNYLKSVIFTTKNVEKMNFSPSLKQRIKKTLKLKPLTEYESIQILQDKSGNILTEDIMKKVFELSENNNTKLLKNCEEVCKFVAKNKPKELSAGEAAKIIKK